MRRKSDKPVAVPSPAMTTGVGWHLRAQQTGIREENNE
jgi:hypothetical protein